MRQSGRDKQTARQTPSVGPLGAVNVQQALDLIAAAGPFFTTEETPSFPLTSSFTPIKTLTINVGTTRTLFALLHITGGTPPAPTKAADVLLTTATRTSGGITTVSGLAELESATISGFNLRWVVSGVDVALEARAASADSVRILLQYLWLEQLPP